MAALKERLDTQEAGLKNTLLLRVLDGVTERLQVVEDLRRELAGRIDLLRQDAQKSAE